MFVLRSVSPQNVYLLPQRQNFSLERCPRPKQICDHLDNESDKISHPVTASPDSRLTASQIEFATGTGRFAPQAATRRLLNLSVLAEQSRLNPFFSSLDQSVSPNQRHLKSVTIARGRET